MKYMAIENFSDKGTIYKVGEEYPADGKPNKERIKAFLSDNNGFGRPIIEEATNTSNDYSTNNDEYSY